MFSFTPQQQKIALLWFSLIHIVVLTLSNYLVHYPVFLFGFHTTWGAFIFPFIFVTTNLTVRIFGASLARRVVGTVMVPALFISYLMSILLYVGPQEGNFAPNDFNSITARITAASVIAYVGGQLLCIRVFDLLCQCSAWWVAPMASVFVGNISDTLSFFFTAFYKSSDTFMAAHWIEITLVNYIFKLFICLVFFLPIYGVILNILLKYLVISPVRRFM